LTLDQSSELVLRPSTKKMAKYLLICAVFVAIGILDIYKVGASTIGWLCVVFFGLGAIVFALQFIPRASYLWITNEGFTFCSLFRRSPVFLWHDVSDFRVASVPPSRHPLVVFNWTAKPDRRIGRVNRHLVGATDGLPDTYGLRPEELADLMNDWRSRGTS
jgi:hypothetical protein